MVERAAIHVTGVVQGVGFRPFVYTLATRLDLQGFVQNRGAHVYIDVEGDPQSLAIFVEQLVDGPPAAAVERIERARLTPIHHRGFVISGSSTALDVSIRIAPDVATCDGCLTELFDPTNEPQQVTLDCKHLSFVDYSAIEALKVLRDRYARTGKQLRVVHLSERCKQLLRRAGQA